MNKNIIVAIGSDRRGYSYKSRLIKFLQSNNYKVIDAGPYDENLPYDYPIYGSKVGKLVTSKKANFGIVICGTGIGIALAASKVDGVRCGIAYDDEVAGWMRKHNDANVVGFGQDFMKYEDVERRVKTFLTTDFLGDYHCHRIKQLRQIEEGKRLIQSKVKNKQWRK